ncbi:hypothetical protein PR003_g8698 [Phytophthora rubi]|uniref:Uncharacterized protein n=1 Tax=Phytophthora rubi TaxID=129364 RepID=A0A6A4FGB2_9STRA|nr:hypothetical protein PR002_g29399 [Phytophthora rubi]KAE9038254.1 hypothetical protein PR001_g8019 [Phytophthora rubi]KAE9343963.1 hypothetical protein PR003_g8698 [Phytophthora rubi]
MSVITQDESLELLMLMAAFGEEETWMELASMGAFDTPERPLIPAVRFKLRTYGSANAVLDFRFDIEGVRALGRHFRLPETVITEDGDRCSKDEALAIMLNRMSSPQRLHDMSSKFGRSSGSICRIFLWMSTYVLIYAN